MDSHKIEMLESTLKVEHEDHPTEWPDWLRLITPAEMTLGTLAKRREVMAFVLESLQECNLIQTIKQVKNNDSAEICEDSEAGVHIRANRAFLYIDFWGTSFTKSNVNLKALRQLKYLLDKRLKEYLVIDQKDSDLAAIHEEMKFRIGRADWARFVGFSADIIDQLDHALTSKSIAFNGSYSTTRKLRGKMQSLVVRSKHQTLNVYDKVPENNHKRNKGTAKQAYYQRIFNKLGAISYIRAEIRYKDKRSCAFLEDLLFSQQTIGGEKRFLTEAEICRKSFERYWQYHHIVNDDGSENAIWNALFNY